MHCQLTDFELKVHTHKSGDSYSFVNFYYLNIKQITKRIDINTLVFDKRGDAFFLKLRKN